jgi:hypothetical protein
MISLDALRYAYQERQGEGIELAGSILDLQQRAAVYHQLYADSNRNHVFPLIAAHGALWAGGYFAFGMKLGRLLSLPSLLIHGRRKILLKQLQDFADAFREVNRRVCVDTYASFHFSDSNGDHPDAHCFVPAAMLEGLAIVHRARRHNKRLSRIERQRVFEAFFRAEQSAIVGPSVRKAAEEFRWPLMRFLALRPCIQFSYFPSGTNLWFWNFSKESERIGNGLKALAIAETVGLDSVEKSLWNKKGIRLLPTKPTLTMDSRSMDSTFQTPISNRTHWR